MRSKLLYLAPVEELASRPIRVSLSKGELRANVERELEDLRVQSRRTVPVETVAPGDTVCVTLESTDRRYCRKALWLTVGMGLFDRDLENTLPGRTAGSVYGALVKETPVTVHVESCLRTEIPELSDGLIARLELPEVSTLAQYRERATQKYRKLYRQWYLEYLADSCMEQWFAASRWELDTEELEAFYRNEELRQERISREHETVLVGNYPGQIEEMLRADGKRYLQAVLVTQLREGADGENAEAWLDNNRLRREILGKAQALVTDAISPVFELQWEEEV